MASGFGSRTLKRSRRSGFEHRGRRSTPALRSRLPLLVAVVCVAPGALADEPAAPRGLIAPVLRSETSAAYPPEAEALGLEGVVRLHVDIDERGEVYRVEVVDSPDVALSWAAMGSAARMRFEPARLSGEPVAVRIDHVVSFELSALSPPVDPAALAPPLAPPALPDGDDREDTVLGSGARELSMVVRERAPARSASERHFGPEVLRSTNRKSAEDLLALAPGVHVAQHGAEGKGQQIFLRGFDAGHGSDVEVTVDGVPVNEASHVHGHGYLDLGFVIPEVVQGLDVYKGAYRLSQGAFATAGTFAFQLGVPDEERGLRLRYEVADTNRHRALAIYAPKGQPAGTFLAGELLHDDGFGELRRAERASLLGRASLPLAEGGELFALTSLYAATFDAPGALRLDDLEAGRVRYGDSYLDDAGGLSLRALASAGYRGRVVGGALEATLYARARRLSLDENYTGFLQDEVRGDRRLQAQNDAGLGARVFHERRLLGALVGFGSLRWEGDAVEQSEHALDHKGGVHQARRELAFTQQRLAMTTGLRWHAPGWLYLEGGARVDGLLYAAEDRLASVHGRGARLVASPRALASLGPFAGVKAFAAYGRGFRPPEARAFTLAAPLAGVPSDPIVVDTAELGLAWSPNERLRLSLTGFALYVEREVLFDHLSGSNRATNASARLGTELSASLAATPWLRTGGDLSVVDARYLQSGAPVPGAPPLLGNLHVVLHGSGAFLALRWFLLGARPLGYGARTPAVALLNLGAGYSLGAFSADVAVDNALDAEWAEAAYAYASYWDRARPRSRLPSVHVVAGPPRTLRLGLSASF